MTGLYVLLAVVALLALAGVLIFNALIAARNRVDEAWSGIDVQLKRRHDLVPNLVAAVKGYAAHEREVLERVTEARSRAIAAAGPQQRGPAEAALGSAIGPVVALAEQYPELRATENFGRLTAELAQLEDEIQASRRLYNGNVQRYQTKKQQFPASVVAGMGDFPDKPLFALDRPSEREVPAVSFA
jgi:LemA protein